MGLVWTSGFTAAARVHAHPSHTCLPTQLSSPPHPALSPLFLIAPITCSDTLKGICSSCCVSPTKTLAPQGQASLFCSLMFPKRLSCVGPVQLLSRCLLVVGISAERRENLRKNYPRRGWTTGPVVRGPGPCASPWRAPGGRGCTPLLALHTHVGVHLRTLHHGPATHPAPVHALLTWLWFTSSRGAD